MKKTTPTMKDVAREAGVALGTVSRVFSGQAVGEEYRIRVEKAAQKLNYQINPYARSLKTNKTNIVAVILPDVTNPFFANLSQHLYLALEEKGYRMMLFLTDSNLLREADCIRMVRQNKVDGIIGLTYSQVEINSDIPFISIDRHFEPGIPCVASDNYGGGRLAAERLARSGCKNLLFFRRQSSIVSEPDKRGDGFVAGCNQLGIPCQTVTIKDTSEITPFADYLAEHIKDGKADFDGIFCNTDLLAIQIAKLLKKFNLQIPEDVQIIGFDGIKSFVTDHYVCSTIIQDTDRIARTAIDLLLREDKHMIPSLICLPVTFAEGGTTR